MAQFCVVHAMTSISVRLLTRGTHWSRRGHTQRQETRGSLCLRRERGPFPDRARLLPPLRRRPSDRLVGRIGPCHVRQPRRHRGHGRARHRHLEGTPQALAPGDGARFRGGDHDELRRSVSALSRHAIRRLEDREHRSLGPRPRAPRSRPHRATRASPPRRARPASCTHQSLLTIAARRRRSTPRSSCRQCRPGAIRSADFAGNCATST